MSTSIYFRRGLSAEWTNVNPVLGRGEPGFENDTGRFKIGNGNAAWNDLAYLTDTDIDSIPGLRDALEAAETPQGAQAKVDALSNSLANVATSGSYDHLTNRPTIPSTPGDIGAASIGDLSAKADLDEGGHVPVAQLPSFVSDVVEVADYASLPSEGESAVIYVTLDTNGTWRWTGSAYVQIGDGGVELGSTSATAHRGDHGATAYSHSQASGNPHGTAPSDIGAATAAQGDLADSAVQPGDLTGALADKADLDGSGHVPVSQLPSFVSDVVEVADYASLPSEGEPSTIYVTLDTNGTWRWTGSAYVQIGDGGVELGSTSATAHRGDHGVTAYSHSQSSGNPHGTTPADIGAATSAQGDLADSAVQPGDLTGEGLATYDPGTRVIDVPASAVEQIADDAAAERVSFAGQTGSLGLRPQHLDGWWSALEARHSTPADIVLIGDSLMSLNMYETPAIGQHVEHILNGDRAAAFTGGVGGWRCANPTGLAGGLTPHFATCDGTTTAAAPGAAGMVMDAGDTATVAGAMQGISIVYASAPGAGSIEVRDGVGGTLLDTIDADDSAGWHVWTSGSTAPSEALPPARTIELTVTGATVTVAGALIHRRNRAGGVRVWNCARSGYSTQHFIDNPEIGLDMIDTVQPDLVVLATGTNDGGAANYNTRMRNLVAAVRQRHAGPIALWIPHLSANVTTTHVAHAYAIATEFDLGVVDASELIGQPIQQANMGALGVHQNNASGSMEAIHLAAALSGDPFATVVKASRPTHELVATNGTATTSILPTHIVLNDGSGEIQVRPMSARHVAVSSPLGLIFGAIDGILRVERVHLRSLSGDPTDAAEVGELCVVNGVVKVCTAAGTPGTWTVVGTQT